MPNPEKELQKYHKGDKPLVDMAGNVKDPKINRINEFNIDTDNTIKAEAKAELKYPTETDSKDYNEINPSSTGSILTKKGEERSNYIPNT